MPLCGQGKKTAQSQMKAGLPQTLQGAVSIYRARVLQNNSECSDLGPAPCNPPYQMEVEIYQARALQDKSECSDMAG